MKVVGAEVPALHSFAAGLDLEMRGEKSSLITTHKLRCQTVWDLANARGVRRFFFAGPYTYFNKIK
jgi:hypothetical protein